MVRLLFVPGEPRRYPAQNTSRQSATMNDSKWRRLIHAIGSVDLPVSFWTFLGDVTEYRMPTPSADQISTCDGGRGIGDHNACGPFFFGMLRGCGGQRNIQDTGLEIFRQLTNYNLWPNCLLQSTRVEYLITNSTKMDWCCSPTETRSETCRTPSQTAG